MTEAQSLAVESAQRPFPGLRTCQSHMSGSSAMPFGGRRTFSLEKTAWRRPGASYSPCWTRHRPSRYIRRGRGAQSAPTDCWRVTHIGVSRGYIRTQCAEVGFLGAVGAARRDETQNLWFLVGIRPFSRLS